MNKKQPIITEEQRQAGLDKKKGKMELRKTLAIPPMSKAIRAKCLDCCGGSANEVKLCGVSKCPLFPFRFGRNPSPADLKVPKYDSEGNVIGYEDYQGFLDTEPTDE